MLTGVLLLFAVTFTSVSSSNCSSFLVVGWSRSSIYRLNLSNASVTALTTVGSARAVAVDTINRTMFWSEDGWRLYQAHTDDIKGTRAQLKSGNWFGLAVDTDQHLLFLSLAKHGVVMMSYSGVQIASKRIPGYGHSYGIVTDQLNQTVYWTDYLNHRLQSIQYNATNFTGPVTTILPNTGLHPTGITLDSLGSTLYYMLLNGHLMAYDLSVATLTINVTTKTNPSFGVTYCGDELYIVDRNRNRIMAWSVLFNNLTRVELLPANGLRYPIAITVED